MTGRAELSALLGWARAVQRGDVPGSLPLFLEVAERAAEAGESLVAADAWLGYGESLGQIDGRERESLRYFDRAASLAPGTPVAALASLAAGDVLRGCGDAEPAADSYARAVTIFEGIDDVFGECLARRALADLQISLDLVDEAMPQVACASMLALQADEPELAADLQGMLGQRLAASKRFGDAVSPLSVAADLSRMLGNYPMEMRARSALLNAVYFAEPDATAAHHAQLARVMELATAGAGADAGPADRASCEARARFRLAGQLRAASSATPHGWRSQPGSRARPGRCCSPPGMRCLKTAGRRTAWSASRAPPTCWPRPGTKTAVSWPTRVRSRHSPSSSGGTSLT